jgi:hypothetical protein
VFIDHSEMHVQNNSFHVAPRWTNAYCILFLPFVTVKLYINVPTMCNLLSISLSTSFTLRSLNCACSTACDNMHVSVPLLLLRRGIKHVRCYLLPSHYSLARLITQLYYNMVNGIGGGINVCLSSTEHVYMIPLIRFEL